MIDRDLALWLQGAAAMIGDRLPTELEWKAMKEKVDEVVAQRVFDRLVQDKQAAVDYAQLLKLKQQEAQKASWGYGGTKITL